ncbi:serine hydrolase [Stutzerimonas xanthomarina]|uniref:serine hydrolase n=1 Tax=Stutzerimonas xanthomarina TaxID=271420 RepID=UPI003AA9462B
MQTELKLTQFFNDWQPQHATGTYRTYANPSIGLLGRAAAKTLGLPYVDALQFHLLPKLGMTDTYIAVPPEQMTRYAQGYNKTGEPVLTLSWAPSPRTPRSRTPLRRRKPATTGWVP